MSSQRPRRASQRATQVEDAFEEEDVPQPKRRASQHRDSQRLESPRAGQSPRYADGAGPSQVQTQRQGQAHTQSPLGLASPTSDKPRSKTQQPANAPPSLKVKTAEVAQWQQIVTRYKDEADKHVEQSQLNLDNEEFEELIGRVVRAMLFSHYEKPGVPVPRTKLLDALTVGYGGRKQLRNIGQASISMAQARLVSVFGLEMREVEKRRGEAPGAKAYVLRSALPAQLQREVVKDPLRGRGAHPALTLLLLAIIHLEGGKVEEGPLMSRLEQLGVCLGVDHPVFGKVKEELDKLKDSRYVVRSNVVSAAGGQEPQAFQYEWAECAFEEVRKEGVERFIEEVFAAQPRHNTAGTQQEVIELE